MICTSNDYNISNEDNYNWMRKQYRMDMSKITEKVDENELMKVFIKTNYPDKWAKISKFIGPQY